MVTSSYSQEFLGIKVDGKFSTVIEKFKAKGFKLTGITEKRIASMKGIAAGKQVELNIVCSPISKTVWKFSVYLPEHSTWSALKNEYSYYLDLLTEKYGEPNNKYDFFSDPYSEGDGYEETAVKTEKCTFSAFWDLYSVNISKWMQVNITYENLVNSQIDDAENKKLKKDVF